MNADQISTALTRIEHTLSRHGYTSHRCSEVILAPPCAKGSRHAGDHARWMCSEVRRFLAAGDVGRALRWTKFILGITFALGIYTLEEIFYVGEEDE